MHELVLHTRDYAQFCDAAFVGFLHHTPESAMNGAALARTFRLAQQDEGCEPTRLPLLFRVDRQLKISGGRRHLADCGGRGQCATTCRAPCVCGTSTVRDDRAAATGIEAV